MRKWKVRRCSRKKLILFSGITRPLQDRSFFCPSGEKPHNMLFWLTLSHFWGSVVTVVNLSSALNNFEKKKWKLILECFGQIWCIYIFFAEKLFYSLISGLFPQRTLKMGMCSGCDAWIVPAFCSGSSQHRALKTKMRFRIYPKKIWLVFWHNAIIYTRQRVSVSRMHFFFIVDLIMFYCCFIPHRYHEVYIYFFKSSKRS